MIENKNIQRPSKVDRVGKKEIPLGVKPKKNDKNNSSNLNTNVNTPIFDDPTDNLLYNINRYALLVNKLDNYGNSIPLGAFCYAFAFLLYGLYELDIQKFETNYLLINILLFGGLGQIMAGIFEYIKGRTFPANLYLIYGIYFVCLYFFLSQGYVINDDCRKFFYGSWAGLTFPLFIGSFQTNVFYLLQTLIGCSFFVIKCIGECKDISAMRDKTSGILEMITGVVSLYICFNQIINDTFKFQLLPSIPFAKDNDIDIYAKKPQEQK